MADMPFNYSWYFQLQLVNATVCHAAARQTDKVSYFELYNHTSKARPAASAQQLYADC
jgi:hypothetical protein